ncbi:hypothetical protein [Winogradskyella pulchriflava]|uniref:Uncharacterized protein n=1 Tax=Winogradskyella pulchriflava TaxID=1110688 RepID=A0ABV6QCA8_9FLAO
MHKIEVTEANHTFLFPESALEFTKEQTLVFARASLLYLSKQITFSQLKTTLAYNFLNLKRRADLTKAENSQIAENINIISTLTEAYFTQKRIDGKNQNQIVMDFYLQKIPSFKIDGITFYGPTDALFNTVYGEYLQLINHFTTYSQTQNIGALNAMIATIYRPEKDNYNTIKNQTDYDGDRRKKFNSALTDHYSTFIDKLGFDTKYAIYLYVASCQHFIATTSALDIGGGATIDLTILFNETQTTKKNNLGLLGTLYSLAETKVFGNIKEVAEQNTYDILAYLVNQTNEYNKNKRNATNT